MTSAARHPRHHYHLPHGIEYPAVHSGTLTITAQVIWVATGLIIELLTVRFMIAFLGANPDNTFFGWLYSASQPFIQPFANLIGDLTQIGPNRFEAYTLLAIAFYGLIVYGIAKLLTLGEPDVE